MQEKSSPGGAPENGLAFQTPGRLTAWSRVLEAHLQRHSDIARENPHRNPPKFSFCTPFPILRHLRPSIYEMPVNPLRFTQYY